jgi:hypothetical protein
MAAMLVPMLLMSAPSTAAPRYSGVITGSFVAPVLSGAFLRTDSHEPVPCNNAAVAASSGAGTATIAWGGDDNGRTAMPSSLTFSGDVFNDVRPGQVFRLGTLTFVNGPTAPGSLIFGFDMQLSAGDGVAPFTGLVEIVSTQNARVDRVADADVLSFADFDVPGTLAAFEDASVTAIVNGTIGDDGRLRVTSIGLAPDESEHGCVGAAPFVASTGPCVSGCDDLPTTLRERIRTATDRLTAATSAGSGRKAKRAGRLAMRQLRRAASRGQISPSCAQAIAAAVANAEAQVSR